MICENCGDQIRRGDNYCSNCGMELLVSEHKPLQKKYLSEDHGSEKHFQNGNNHYYESEQTEYEGGYDYEESERSSGWLPIILFLVLILMVGFVAGLIWFTSQKIP